MDVHFDEPGVAEASIPLLAHVPHGSTVVPPEVRAGLLIDDAALRLELLRMTDHFTEELFVPPVLAMRGSAFVNRISRLVVDPERFVDDAREVMAQRGMGAVYVSTHVGSRLRSLTPAGREELVGRWFEPYARAIDRRVHAVLERFGRCLIVDSHSFPSRPLPYELVQDPKRPEVCIGTDPDHTPPAIAGAVERVVRERRLEVTRDRPFAGTYVPSSCYRRDRRVASIMLEIRRDLYMDEATGDRGSGFDAAQDLVRDLVDAAYRAFDRAGESG